MLRPLLALPFLLVTIVSGTLPAQELELRCRGRSGEGVPIRRQGPDWRDPASGEMRAMLALRFTAAPVAAGADGSGLPPGTCAWVDRPLGRGEPRTIWFEVPVDPRADANDPLLAERRPSVATIPAYLRSDEHVWSFWSDGSGAHQLTARRHAAWTPGGGGLLVGAPAPAAPTTEPPAPAASSSQPPSTSVPAPQQRPGSGVRDRPYRPGQQTSSTAAEAALRLREVQASPTGNNVVITFRARQNSRPHLEIRDPNDVLESWHVTGGRPAQGAYTFDYAQHARRGHREAARAVGLRPGVTYRYTITIPAGGGLGEERHTGTFTTPSQTVIVRFRQVHILNDSDSGGLGELSFRFYVASVDEEEACEWLDECARTSVFFGRPWGTGETHALRDSVRFTNAPDRIRVWVKGWDYDGLGDAHRLTEPEIHVFSGEGGSNSLADWNFAKGVFDVGPSPDARRRIIPFRLRSRDGHVLMFEVQGEIEVVRN